MAARRVPAFPNKRLKRAAPKVLPKKTGPKKKVAVLSKKPEYAKLPGVREAVTPLYVAVGSLNDNVAYLNRRQDSVVHSLDTLLVEVRNLRTEILVLKEVIQEMVEQAERKAETTAEKLLARPRRRVRKLGAEMTGV